MKILRVWMWPILLSLTVFLALGVPDVNAAALQFTSGAVQTTINDGQILADFDPTAGSVVAVNTAVDTWLINSAAGITKPALGSAPLPQMAYSFSVTGTGTLTIKFSDIGYTGGALDFQSLFAGNTDGIVSYALYYDDSNTLFGTSSLISSIGPTGATPFAFDVTDFADPTAPYSLTLVATITHATRGTSGPNGQVLTSAAAVPEPGAILLLGSGLVGLVFAGRKRLRK